MSGPYDPSLVEIAVLRGLLDRAQRWIRETSAEIGVQHGIGLADEIRAALKVEPPRAGE